MENLKEYKNKLIGIRNLIIKSLANAESKEEIHRYAISLHNVNEKIKENDSVIEKGEDVNTLPTTKAVCPECGHTEASWWLQQTRSADEAETRFFKCLKCGHTWREYD